MDFHNIIDIFFSDETEMFCSPMEPKPGEQMKLRLRGPGDADGFAVKLVMRTSALEETHIEMKLPHEAEDPGYEKGLSAFVMYEAELTCPDEAVTYHFRMEHDGEVYICQRNGARKLEGDSSGAETIDPRFDFRLVPGFHTPGWSRGAVQYQIFPDRFRNGDAGNDVQNGEYSYNGEHVRKIAEWGAPPVEDDYRCFYGGDLRGIIEKLDYLEELGVEAIYLNPIFLSPSSHKYDAQDYNHIDPHFGVIEEDTDLTLEEWEMHNGYARQYIKRVLSERNVERSDALFAELCEAMHSRGMKIILDGVFNHCGSFHRWMDREGIYRDKDGYPPGAYQSEDSPYRDFFRFTEEEPGYEVWWGVDTLPKLCYEDSVNLQETIFSIAEKWLRPPYSIDGWRLDVAADLGHSTEFNHQFWNEFRKRVKAVNPEALIIAEHYGDPADWLRGDEWDSVMNYDAFMEPLTYFLTGMEKHSDGAREDLYQNGEQFFAAMQNSMASFRSNSLQCAMNELSNHDHSRFLTRTNRIVGRVQTHGPEAADTGVDKAVFREAVAIQMTWPGAPTIYYGDEAGLAGWTDPDNRRCYPWGSEDTDLIEYHRRLISLRHRCPLLRTGSLIPLGAGTGWISYARFDENDCILVVCNNGTEECKLSIDAWKAGAADGTLFYHMFSTDRDTYSDEIRGASCVSEGKLEMDMKAQSVVILGTENLISRPGEK